MHDNEVFINSKKTFEVRHPETGIQFNIKKDFLGFIPKWVTESKIFQLAVQELSIILPMSTSDADLQAAAETTAPTKKKATK